MTSGRYARSAGTAGIRAAAESQRSPTAQHPTVKFRHKLLTNASRALFVSTRARAHRLRGAFGYIVNPERLQRVGAHVARPLPNIGGHAQEARPDMPSAATLLRLPRVPAGQGPPAVVRSLIVAVIVRGVLQKGLLQGLHGAGQVMDWT